jgi:polysaccharide deacetylase family protein (PEP-CTERM system associated)
VVDTPAEGRVLALTFDFEDWHQIVHRSLGREDWDRPHLAFRRQIEVVLDLLDELGVRATFFVLGMCARLYPDAVRELARRGHEIACHGLAHRRVFEQEPNEFRRDVQAGLDEIERACGTRPLGYRAPAFSITRSSSWAFDVLAEQGFRYDSSQYDSPRVQDRIRGLPTEPFRLALRGGGELLELPLAVTRIRGHPFPVGGGSYWRVLPSFLLTEALRRATTPGRPATVYLHPYECDPFPLRVDLPAASPPLARAAALRTSLYWNVGRERVVGRLRRVAEAFDLITCEQAFSEACERGDTRTRALSREGVLV